MDFRKTCIALAALTAFAAGARAQGDEIAAEFAAWRPRVEVERVDCLVTCGVEDPAKLSPRVAQRYYGTVASLWDARLFLTFARLSEKLAAKEKGSLRADQAKWLKVRRKAAEAALQKEPGNPYPKQPSLTVIDWTKQREQELRTLFASIESKGDAPSAAKKPAPKRDDNELRDWHPSVNVEDVESLIAAAGSDEGEEAQQRESRLLTTLASLWDARLFLTLTELSDRIGATESGRLRVEQAAWLKSRDEAALGAFAAQEGGTTGPSDEARELIEWTEKRYVELRARLIASEKKPAAKEAKSTKKRAKAE